MQLNHVTKICIYLLVFENGTMRFLNNKAALMQHTSLSRKQMKYEKRNEERQIMPVLDIYIFSIDKRYNKAVLHISVVIQYSIQVHSYDAFMKLIAPDLILRRE